MHYFNRLSFQLKGDMLSITNLQTENEVRVYKKNESLEAEYYVRKKLIAKSKRSVEKKRSDCTLCVQSLLCRGAGIKRVYLRDTYIC